MTCTNHQLFEIKNNTFPKGTRTCHAQQWPTPPSEGNSSSDVYLYNPPDFWHIYGVHKGYHTWTEHNFPDVWNTQTDIANWATWVNEARFNQICGWMASPQVCQIRGRSCYLPLPGRCHIILLPCYHWTSDTSIVHGCVVLDNLCLLICGQAFGCSTPLRKMEQLLLIVNFYYSRWTSFALNNYQSSSLLETCSFTLRKWAKFLIVLILMNYQNTKQK